MRSAPLLSALRNRRGQIIIFTMIALVFLLVIGGSLASDVAKLIAAKNEVQSSLDAAALAGAGKLGFDATVFDTARTFAVNFAKTNKTRTGDVDLVQPNANAGDLWQTFDAQPMPYGDVTLGIWDPSKPDGIGSGKRFEPSVDGTIVNAVMCRYKKQIAGNFMSLWGFFPMNVAASAVATSNPPNWPPTPCVFPIGLSSCPFTGGEVFSSEGCGKPIKFVTSNGQADSTNTAAWLNLGGTGTPSASYLRDQIAAASSGSCNTSPPAVNTSVGTQNGMTASVFGDLRDAFKAQFNASVSSGTMYDVKDSQGNVTYHGPGWEVWVPVIQTECDASGNTQAIVSTHTIIGWTKFVMTQAWDSTGANPSKIGLGCVVENTYDTKTWPYCQATDQSQLPSGLQGGASRSLFGVYSCALVDTTPTQNPAPRSALATKLRLVR